MALLRRVQPTLLLVVLISGGAVSHFLDFDQFTALTLQGDNSGVRVRCTCHKRTEPKEVQYFTLQYRVHGVPGVGTDLEGNTRPLSRLCSQSAFFANGQGESAFTTLGV